VANARRKLLVPSRDQLQGGSLVTGGTLESHPSQATCRERPVRPRLSHTSGKRWVQNAQRRKNACDLAFVTDQFGRFAAVSKQERIAKSSAILSRTKSEMVSSGFFVFKGLFF
jgi:hypothetical protein